MSKPAPFDPDAYLAQTDVASFDPDAYLAQFGPQSNALADAARRFATETGATGWDAVAGLAALPRAAASKVVDTVAWFAVKNGDMTPEQAERRRREILGLVDQSTAAQALQASAENARGIADFTRANSGADPLRDQTLLAQLAAGAGSLPAAIATGPAAPAVVAGMMGEAQRRDAAESLARRGITDPAEIRRAEDTALVLGAPVGFASEALLGVPAMLKSVRGMGAGTTAARRIATQTALGAAREGAQEGIEQATGNVIAADLAAYDPERSRLEGVGQSMLLGAAIGAPVAGAFQGAQEIDARREHANFAAGLDTAQNIPEATKTLLLQQDQLARGLRPAMMFPEGTPELPLPDGLERLKTERGTFHFNPAQINAQNLALLSSQGRENEILGLGPVSKPAAEARAAATGEPLVTVTERAPDGTEVKAAVGTTGTAAAQAAALAQSKTPGNTVAVETPAQTLIQRTQAALAEQQAAARAAAEAEARERAERQAVLDSHKQRLDQTLSSLADWQRGAAPSYEQLKAADTTLRFALDNLPGLDTERRQRAAAALRQIERPLAEAQLVADAANERLKADLQAQEAARDAEIKARLKAERDALQAIEDTGRDPREGGNIVDITKVPDEEFWNELPNRLDAEGLDLPTWEKEAERRTREQEAGGDAAPDITLADAFTGKNGFKKWFGRPLRLPTAAALREAGDPLAGDMEAIQETLPWQWFDSKARNLDNLAETLRGYGFEFSTPGELLAALRSPEDYRPRADMGGADQQVDFAEGESRIPFSDLVDSLVLNDMERDAAREWVRDFVAMPATEAFNVLSELPLTSATARSFMRYWRQQNPNSPETARPPADHAAARLENALAIQLRINSQTAAKIVRNLPTMERAALDGYLAGLYEANVTQGLLDMVEDYWMANAPTARPLRGRERQPPATPPADQAAPAPRYDYRIENYPGDDGEGWYLFENGNDEPLVFLGDNDKDPRELMQRAQDGIYDVSMDTEEFEGLPDPEIRRRIAARIQPLAPAAAARRVDETGLIRALAVERSRSVAWAEGVVGELPTMNVRDARHFIEEQRTAGVMPSILDQLADYYDQNNRSGQRINSPAPAPAEPAEPAKPDPQLEQAGRFFREIATQERAWQFGREGDPKRQSKNIADVAATFSTDKLIVEAQWDAKRQTGMIGVYHRKADDSRGSRIGGVTLDLGSNNEIRVGATGANSNQAADMGGKNMYQTIFTWAHNNGYRVLGNQLSPVNQVRRTVNMLSSALRHGTTAHIVPYGTQRIDGWIDGGPEVLDHNVGAMLRALSIQLSERTRGRLDALTYDPASDSIVDNVNGRRISEDDLRRIIETAKLHVDGFGPATARAVLAGRAQLAANARGQGPDLARARDAAQSGGLRGILYAERQGGAPGTDRPGAGRGREAGQPRALPRALAGEVGAPTWRDLPPRLTDAEVEARLAEIKAIFPQLARSVAISTGDLRQLVARAWAKSDNPADRAAAKRLADARIPANIEAARTREAATGRPFIAISSQAAAEGGLTSLALHEIGHVYWDVLPDPVRSFLRQLHAYETSRKTGPLYKADKSRATKIKFEREQFSAERLAADPDLPVKEWFCERIAAMNRDWLRGKMPSETPVLQRIWKTLKDLFARLVAFHRRLDPASQVFERAFRRWLAAGDVSAASAAPAFASRDFAQFATSQATFDLGGTALGLELPDSIRNLTPKWQDKTLRFDSNLDKALYYAGGEGRTATKDGIIAHLERETGLSRGEIATLARDLRRKLGALAQGVARDGTLRVGPQMQAEARQLTGVSFAQGNRRDQTDTPEFKRWFGDSKVVDAQGKPLVVYHGTTRQFIEFSKVSDLNRLDGFYFGSQKDANFYAGENDGGQVIPAYLAIKNPASKNDMDRVSNGISMYASNRGDRVKQALIAEGFDGAVLYFPDSGETEYVAFYPTQIKSAIGNRGSFDPADPRIDFAEGDQTDTPEFKRQFAGSQVVDAQGNPMVVYRGEWGDPAANSFAATRLGLPTFTDAKSIAETYAADGEAGRLVPAYLAIKNPLRFGMQDGIVTKAEMARVARALRLTPDETNNLVSAGGWVVDGQPESFQTLAEIPAGAYVEAPTLADTAMVQEKARAAGFDGIIIRGIFTSDAEPGGSFDGVTAIEYRPFSESQIIPSFSAQDIDFATSDDPEAARYVAEAARFREETPAVPEGSLRDNRAVRSLAPYLISGNKGDIVGKHGRFFDRLAQAATKVVDAFGGAAIYTHYLADREILPAGSMWNEWEYSRSITNRQIAARPDQVADEIKKLRADFLEAFPADSLPKTREEMLNLRERINAWMDDRLRQLVPDPKTDAQDRLVLPDTPSTAAFYLFAQNHMTQNRVVDFELVDGRPAFTTGGKVNGKDDFNFIAEVEGKRGRKQIEWTRPARVWNHKMPGLLRDAARRLRNVNVQQGDGWKLSAEAPAGSLVFVDSSYFQGDEELAAGKDVMNYGTSTLEDGDWRKWLAKARRLLVPRGDEVRYVVTNNFNAQVVAELEKDGWTLLRTTRKTNSGKEAHELIALSPAAARAAGVAGASRTQARPALGSLAGDNGGRRQDIPATEPGLGIDAAAKRSERAKRAAGLKANLPPGVTTAAALDAEQQEQAARLSAAAASQRHPAAQGDVDPGDAWASTPKMSAEQLRAEIRAISEYLNDNWLDLADASKALLRTRQEAVQAELDRRPKAEQKAAAAAPAAPVPVVPKPDRKDALLAAWREGKRLRDEGNRTGNQEAWDEGQKQVTQAKAALDREFPEWEAEANPSRPTPRAEATDAKNATVGPRPARADQIAQDDGRNLATPPPEPPERGAPIADEPAPDRGRARDVFGHSSVTPSWWERTWEKAKRVLVGFRGAIPELPALPSAKDDPFIAREGPNFYDGLRAFLRALGSGNDYVQRTAEQQVAEIVTPLLGLGGRFDADAYARLRRLRERQRLLAADGRELPAGPRAELDALQLRLESHPYALFNKLVFFMDLDWRRKNLKDSEGNPIRLPYNLNETELQAELDRLGAAIQASPHAAAIEAAYEKHMALVKRTADDLKHRDLLVAEHLTNPVYFPHQLLEVERGGKTEQRELTPERVRVGTEADFRGYLQEPVGSDKPIESDYVRAMYYHLVQVGAHNLKADALRDHVRPYDVRAEVEQRAKALTKERGRTVSWEQAYHEEYSPRGYVLYGTNSRDAFPTVQVDREKLARRLGVVLTSEPLEKQFAELGLRGIKLLPEDLRETLVQGEREVWIVPARVAEALRGIADRQKETDGAIGVALRAANTWWKQWKLFMPQNHLRYEYGNVVADLEKLFSASPRTFRHLGRAAKELRAFFQGEAPGPELAAALKDGVINAITAQEMNQLQRLRAFEKFQTTGEKIAAQLKRRSSSLAFQPITNLVGLGDLSSVELSAFREGVTRYANFLANLDAIRNNARPDYAGAHGPDIEAIGDSRPGANDRAYRQAAQIAKATFGDYADLSVSGQWLRDKMVPFYSWMEINFKYHANLFRNNLDLLRGRGTRAQGGAAVARQSAALVGGFALRLALPYVIIAAWNALGSGVDDDELSEEDRRRVHIRLGHDDEGKPIVIYANTALADVMKWLSGPRFTEGVGAWLRGDTDAATAFDRWASSIPGDLANNTLGSAGPTVKIPAMAITERNYFPDVLDAKKIPDYDMRRAILGQITDEFTADQIERLVNQDYAAPKDYGTWAKQLVLQMRQRDPESWAFYSIKDKAATFVQERTGQKRDTGYDAPDQQVLRNFRRAIYQGDVEQAARFYLRLLDYGYTAERFTASIRAQEPLAGVPREHRRAFVESLSPIERRQLDRAYAYYTRIGTLKGTERALFPPKASGERGQERWQERPRTEVLERMMERREDMTEDEVLARADRILRASLAGPN